MHLYLNYAQELWTREGENPPVGLILCTRKDASVAHYALEGLPNKVLAAEYRTVLPDADKIAAELTKARLALETRRKGAIAVARPEDAGRFGSHRFITCVAKPGEIIAQFLRFYFLTNEGLELIRAASPGGAGRNRTLGLDALSNVRVPVPSYELQTRFDALQSEVDNFNHLQTKTTAEFDALLPAIFDQAFKGELL